MAEPGRSRPIRGNYLKWRHYPAEACASAAYVIFLPPLWLAKGCPVRKCILKCLVLVGIFNLKSTFFDKKTNGPPSSKLWMWSVLLSVKTKLKRCSLILLTIAASLVFYMWTTSTISQYYQWSNWHWFTPLRIICTMKE